MTKWRNGVAADYPSLSRPFDAALWSAAVERLSMGIAVTHAAGRIEYANAWLCRLLGLTALQLAGLDLAQFRGGVSMRLRMEIRRAALAGDTWHGEVELSVGEGHSRPMLESVYPLQDEARRVARVLHFFHDVSALRYADRLSRLAFHDALTGLPNRNLLLDRVDACIAAAQRSCGAFAVLYVDIEAFRRVNDALGRDAGDELLRQIAVRMERALRKSDTIARVGGDELAVLLAGPVNAHFATCTSEKLLRACTGWYERDELRESVTFSVGVAVYPRDGGTANALLQSAESTMYCMKAARRSGHIAGQPCVGSRYALHEGFHRN